jgi:hypothetical protein
VSTHSRSAAWATTCEQERRPVGVYNTVRSAEPEGSFRHPHERVTVDLGGRLPHVWLGSDGRQVSTLDLLGPGFTLVHTGDAVGTGGELCTA